MHILVEETWDARFFWREPALAQGHEDIATHARHIVVTMRGAVGEMLTALARAGTMVASDEVCDGLARQITTGACFHAQTLDLEAAGTPPRELIARAAAQVMMPVAALAA